MFRRGDDQDVIHARRAQPGLVGQQTDRGLQRHVIDLKRDLFLGPLRSFAGNKEIDGPFAAQTLQRIGQGNLIQIEVDALCELSSNAPTSSGARKTSSSMMYGESP